MENKNADIIIAGAGASGLMAARELVKKGFKVLVLEARDRIGGRIFTYTGNDIPHTTELGAEFIHGDLPLTLALCKEADISYTASGGKSYSSHKGVLSGNDFSFPFWDLFSNKLRQLQNDMPVALFLDTYFAGDEYTELRQSVKSFAEGYDAADTTKASMFALRDEWLREDENNNYRIDGGYSELMEFLAAQIQKYGGEIILSAAIKEIRWQQDTPEVKTEDGRVYKADKVIVTLPPALWNAELINPFPALSLAAASDLGYGDVVKVIIAFKEKFWESKGATGMGFLFTDQRIPTWWSQYPETAATLTGWLAGPKAAAFKNTPDNDILDIAVNTLASAFDVSGDIIRKKMFHAKVMNWSADVFTKGAYAYKTVRSADAIRILNEPLENKLYFAGEGLYDGDSIGTVEAALCSGRQTADKIASD